MADKTWQNKRFLLFKFIEQKVSRGKPSFFAYVISGERSANRLKQLRNDDVVHVKTSQSAKESPSNYHDDNDKQLCLFLMHSG